MELLPFLKGMLIASVAIYFGVHILLWMLEENTTLVGVFKSSTKGFLNAMKGCPAYFKRLIKRIW